MRWRACVCVARGPRFCCNIYTAKVLDAIKLHRPVSSNNDFSFKRCTYKNVVSTLTRCVRLYPPLFSRTNTIHTLLSKPKFGLLCCFFVNVIQIELLTCKEDPLQRRPEGNWPKFKITNFQANQFKCL